MDTGAGDTGRAVLVNRISVAAFGELEFWFALIKVVIVAMIPDRPGHHLLRLTPLGNTAASFSNLYGATGASCALRHPGRGDDADHSPIKESN